MKQKNRHNPLKDYTDFIYYLVNILLKPPQNQHPEHYHSFRHSEYLPDLH